MSEKNISEEDLNKIAEVSESLDNLVHAMQIPMPASFHIDALKEALPKKINELREIYISISGENPWD